MLRAASNNDFRGQEARLKPSMCKAYLFHLFAGASSIFNNGKGIDKNVLSEICLANISIIIIKNKIKCAHEEENLWLKIGKMQ